MCITQLSELSSSSSVLVQSPCEVGRRRTPGPGCGAPDQHHCSTSTHLQRGSDSQWDARRPTSALFRVSCRIPQGSGWTESRMRAKTWKQCASLLLHHHLIAVHHSPTVHTVQMFTAVLPLCDHRGAPSEPADPGERWWECWSSHLRASTALSVFFFFFITLYLWMRLKPVTPGCRSAVQSSRKT